ncbi:MAG TPA: hypothetical protein VK453_25780 [Micromonosporaceae bacterium]|nr:hypothetical protein [Micromonosporaceae bacterium]
MSSTTTTQASTPLALGETAADTAANGHVVIRVQHVRPGTYSLVTEQGTHRLDDWSGPFTTESAAYLEAQRVRGLFDEHGTDLAIEARRNELTFEHRDLLAGDRRRTANAFRVAQVRAELDQLETLADRKLLAGLRTALAA